MPRTKGSYNYKSLTVGKICERLGFNPIQELLKLYNEKYMALDKVGNPIELCNSPELRAKIASDLLPYIHPKLSAIQVSGDPDSPLIIKIVQSKAKDAT